MVCDAFKLLKYCQEDSLAEHEQELREGAEGNNQAAQRLLIGLLLSDDDQKRQKEGFNLAQKMAEDGDLDAAYYVELARFDGLGCVQDKSRAVQNVEKILEKRLFENDVKSTVFSFIPSLFSKKFGHFVSSSVQDPVNEMRLFLARCYYTGDGVPKNYKVTFKHLVSASNSGSLEARFMLAGLYMEGKGVEVDLKKAISLCADCAKRNFKEAHQVLGELYLHDGNTDSLVQAYVWFLIASGNGQEEAKERMEELEKKLSPEQIDLAQEKARAYWDKF